jgi:hypothetical protein
LKEPVSTMMAGLEPVAEWQELSRKEAKPPCAARAVQGQLPTQL